MADQIYTNIMQSIDTETLALRNFWYPTMFSRDLPRDRPVALTLVDRPLVFYRPDGGAALALDDRCPHRSVPLSVGRMVDGRLECRYHGWQFGADGACTHIPTLPAEAPRPRASCASAAPTVERDGLVWVWPGDPSRANPEDIVHEPEIGAGSWSVVDMTHEFDLEHGLMIENLLDPSHLPFTHEGTLARRGDAAPLEMQLEERPDGFAGVARSPRSDLPMGFTFRAPCLVRLDLKVRPGWDFIQLQYSVPLARGRMRLLSRMVRNWLPWLPDWLTERQSRKILDQDTEMLLGQQRRLEQGARPWNCPVPADRIAVAYRQWRGRLGRAEAVARGA